MTRMVNESRSYSVELHCFVIVEKQITLTWINSEHSVTDATARVTVGDIFWETTDDF